MTKDETGQGARKDRSAMVCVFHLARDEDISGVSGVGEALLAAPAVYMTGHADLNEGRERESHESARRRGCDV
jgi:hypothetical protein